MSDDRNQPRAPHEGMEQPLGPHFAGEWTASERAVVEDAIRSCTHAPASVPGDLEPDTPGERRDGPASRRWICLKLNTPTSPHFAAYEYPDGPLIEAPNATALAQRLHRFGEPEIAEQTGGIPAYRFRRVTDYVRGEMGETIRVKDMARRAQMSEGHFSRQFKRTLGLPPMAYVMQVRLEEVANLLVTTDLGTAEIAALCGFASASHLAARFHAWADLTPSAYRAEHGC